MRRCAFMLAVTAGVSAMLAGCSAERAKVNDSLTKRVDQAIAQATQRRVIPRRQVALRYDGHAERAVDESLFAQASFKPERLSLQLTDASSDQGEVKDVPATFSKGKIFKNDLKSLPKSLWNDTKSVYADKKNLAVLLLGGGASLAVRNTVDDTWEDHFDKHRSLSSGWGETAGVLGNPGLHLGVAAAAYAWGLQTENAKTYSVGKTLFNALVITDLSTMLMKVAANTESPNGENLAWPSGHTSSTFCLAAVLDHEYGPWVGVPLYALGVFVGFERMDDREHHGSDVIFGAVLGVVIGKSVADGHAPEVLGGQIIPYVDPYEGGSGLAWVKEF